MLLLKALQAQDNIKMVPIDTGCQDVLLIHLLRDTDLCRTLLNRVLKWIGDWIY
jgi:hypothetical protein